MARTIKLLESRIMLLLMVAWLGIFAAVSWWPTSWWIEVKTVQVGPAQVSRPVPMAVDRTVKRQFTASWYVTVRKWTERGWVAYCVSNGVNTYHPENVLPAELTLGWWTDGRCATLPAGRFAVDTTWVVHGYGPLPARETHNVSNIFEVTP